MKIAYLPLDERPCNLQYTVNIFSSNHEIKTPNKDLLGYKKQPADIKGIMNWLSNIASSVDAVVISLDMLLYGGLLPSRLHHFSEEDITERIEILKDIKRQNPKLKIYGFQLIMRTPSYNSSDEEPDYYEKYGLNIFKYGIAKHKKQLGLDFEDVYVPSEFITDFENRRSKNISSLISMLNLVKENVFDYFVIPQDDSHEYGYTAIDQEKVISFIKNNNINNILIYPGADEVGAALIGRAVSSRKKRVFIFESSDNGLNNIPKYEDRPQIKSLSAQLKVADLIRVDNAQEADYVIAINTINSEMVESWEWKENLERYNAVRNIEVFVEKIKTFNKVVVLDTAYSNGGDPILIKEMNEKNVISQLHGYFGWNTSSNTIGFGLALINSEKSQTDMLLLKRHLLDDFVYQTMTRWTFYQEILPKLGLSYFDLKNRQDDVIKLEHEHISAIAKKYISTISFEFKHMHPWNRMFEISMEVK